MLNKQFISFITIGLAAMFFGIASVTSASTEFIPNQLKERALVIAQAHQHGQEKDNAHIESKGGHDNGKEEKEKHGDKEGHDMKKGGYDYAHLIIAHADTLKLSDEQLGKIVRLHLKHEQEHERLKEKVKKSMKGFKKESMNPSATDAQLLKLGKDHTDVFKAMVDFHINERKDIHSVLTESQRKTLESLKIDHDHDSHGGKHGGHGDH